MMISVYGGVEKHGWNRRKCWLQAFIPFPMFFIAFFFRVDKNWYCVIRNEKVIGKISVNPLPNIPILGSANSAANKDMMSNILTNKILFSD